MFSANSSQVSEDRLYVEDVFSTYLYTGTGSAQTITNGIDLSGKGGLVWCKDRTYATSNCLVDTARGTTKSLFTNLTDAQNTTFSTITAFNSNGFAVGTSSLTAGLGDSAMASWTFREAPKFFDVVTFSSAGNISHNLGTMPGCIIMKRADGTGNWQVVHIGTNGYGFLNLTNAFGSTSLPGIGTSGAWVNATSTTFNVDNFWGGGTWVAYLFAHDTTSDGIIQCGSLTFPTGTSQVEVNLGWEPQWLLVKSADTADNWYLFDNMRGMGASNVFKDLRANTTAAEADLGNATYPDNITSTGFSLNGGFFGVGTNTRFIYIAIRRGPMRTPTSGTSVFSPIARTGTGGTATVTTNFVADTVVSKTRATSNPAVWFDRLRGPLMRLLSNSTMAEFSSAASLTGFDSNTGYIVGADTSDGIINYNTYTYANYAFRRAPSFFDVVCYTGTGSTATYNHNLGVVPELIIAKRRNSTGTWRTVCNFTPSSYDVLDINSTAAKGNGSYFSGATLASQPTATTFVTGDNTNINASGGTYVAYLFASCPGVSKVGSYTGNGSSQTINCGFAAGARFVMIKRTDSTGDWYVWDTARGIVSGNDPRLSLNSAATEVTTDNSVDTDSSGFVVNQLSATNINVSSATYIYLAVA